MDRGLVVLGEREQVAEVIQNSTLDYANIQQTLALGLLVLDKHDRAETKNGSSFTNAQLNAADAFTAADLGRFREQAAVMLAQFSAYWPHPGWKAEQDGTGGPRYGKAS